VKNLDSIAEQGFKVGGEDDGVIVENGAKYGAGVYAATGPNTPLTYSKNHAKNDPIFLAQGFKGPEMKNGNSRSWQNDCTFKRPVQDWVVFRKGKQLLPKYVVFVTQ
jgi:hypothetical protein